MPTNVIVWDIETVPDIKSFAAANGHGAMTRLGWPWATNSLSTSTTRSFALER
jgi:hypothetical protein